MSKMQSPAPGLSGSQVHTAVCVLLVRFTSVKRLHSVSWHSGNMRGAASPPSAFYFSKFSKSFLYWITIKRSGVCIIVCDECG